MIKLLFSGYCYKRGVNCGKKNEIDCVGENNCVGGNYVEIFVIVNVL